MSPAAAWPFPFAGQDGRAHLQRVAVFPATVTVIGVDLPNVTYNVSITGVW